MKLRVQVTVECDLWFDKPTDERYARSTLTREHKGEDIGLYHSCADGINCYTIRAVLVRCVRRAARGGGK